MGAQADVKLEGFLMDQTTLLLIADVLLFLILLVLVVGAVRR